MPDPITYDGYVDLRNESACLAQLTDLPGCYVLAPTPDEAIARLAASIPAYYLWLQRHDDYTPIVQGPFHVTLKEIDQSTAAAQPYIGAYFAPDAEPITGEDLDWYLSLLDWSFTDFAAAANARLAASISADEPIISALQIQLWLISRLEPTPTVVRVSALPGATRDHLIQIHKASLSRLRNASEDERERLLDHDGQRWTLRRVLRASIVHLREQTAAL